MLPPVYQILSADEAVAAIVGNRIGAHAEVPQDTARPYVTWQLITGAPENSLSDLPDIDSMQVQINCWHQTDAGVRALAQAVRGAIEPHAHVTGYPVNQRETDTRLFWIAIQADWWLPRNPS